MSDTALTTVVGVGSDKADSLRNIGITTAEELANAAPSHVATADGFGNTSAHDVVNAATEAVTTNSPTDDDIEVVLPGDRTAQMFILHALLEEGMSRHQSSSFETREAVFDIVARLTSAINTGDAAEPTLQITPDEADLMYVALNQGWQDYASRPGINSIWEPIQDLSVQVNDKRKR